MKEMYSKKYDLIFYHIPKNAMTTMRNIGFRWEENYNKEAKIFTIIRDPFERLISAYIQAQSHTNRIINNKDPFILRKIEKNKLKGIFLEENINLFINTISEGVFEAHHQPQITFLNDNELNRNINNVNFFLLFENLNGELSKKLNINNPFRYYHNKTNTIKKNQIRKKFLIYKNKIEEIYQEDYQLWMSLKLKS